MDLQILHPLHLGDSSDLQVGQRVYAIGEHHANCMQGLAFPEPPAYPCRAVVSVSMHRHRWARMVFVGPAGNPFGLDHTLTTGVISGTQREIISGINGRPIQGVIQIDAAINVGLILQLERRGACCAASDCRLIIWARFCVAAGQFGGATVGQRRRADW